jgi:hypothetical protein
MNNEDEVIYEWLCEYKYEDSNLGGSYSSGTKWEILSYSKYYTKEEIWDNKGKIYHPEKSFRKIENTKRIREPEVIENYKKVLYTIIDNGIDGREKDKIIRSFSSNEERDKWFDNSKNKNWYRKGEQIIFDDSKEKRDKLFEDDRTKTLDLNGNPAIFNDYKEISIVEKEDEIEVLKFKNEELSKKIKKLEKELILTKELNINFGY